MNSRTLQSRFRSPTPARRGVVVVAVIVAATVCLVFVGIWARAVVSEQRRASNRQYQLQATRLAEAGLRRAIALHAADSSYRGDTWDVAADKLDQTHAGKVHTQLLASDDTDWIQYEATAQFPASDVRRAQVTKSIRLPYSKPAGKL